MNEKTSQPRLTLALLLALGTLLVYWPVGHYEFINYDDPDYVSENPRIQKGLENVGWIFSECFAGNWHPLTWLSHMVDCQLFGLNAGAHHLVNLGFHLANVLLLFWVLVRMTGAQWPAAFVSALFALHPLHVESVAWVSERKDVLSTLLWLLTMLAYARYVEKPGWRRSLLVAFPLALGLMGKATLVTLPFALLLLDFWPLGRFRRASGEPLVPPVRMTPTPRPNRPNLWLVLEKVPLFGLSLVASAVTFWAQKQQGTVTTLSGLSLDQRVANALVSYACYLSKTFWPRPLAVFYPHPGDWPWWKVGGAVALLLLLTFVALAQWKRRPYLIVGWLWYVGTLVPMIGLVQVGWQSMADRYTYVPLIGVFIALTWLAAEMTRRWQLREVITGAVAVVILLVCAQLTARQLGVWKNSVLLFQHALQVTPDNSVAHNNLGDALLDLGQIEEARVQFEAAIKVDPRNYYAYGSLGNALFRQGKLPEATEAYAKGLKVQPLDPVLNYSLGLVLLAQGQPAEAVARFSEALRLRPDYAAARARLERATYWQQRETSLGEDLKLKPDDAALHAELGMILGQEFKTAQAISQYREALRLDPGLVQALNNLAWTLAAHPDARFRDGAEAIRLAERACELTSRSQPRLLGTLAAAYAEVGRFDEATRTAQQASDLATTSNQPAVAEANRALRQLYESRRACRDPQLGAP